MEKNKGHWQKILDTLKNVFTEQDAVDPKDTANIEQELKQIEEGTRTSIRELEISLKTATSGNHKVEKAEKKPGQQMPPKTRPKQSRQIEGRERD